MADLRNDMRVSLEKDLGRSNFLTEFICLEVIDIDLRYSLAHIDEVSILAVINGIVCERCISGFFSCPCTMQVLSKI